MPDAGAGAFVRPPHLAELPIALVLAAALVCVDDAEAVRSLSPSPFVALLPDTPP
jgi:hypothetical protein